MTAPDTSDTTTGRGAIRAGECPYCDALFLLPGAGDENVLCPGCDKEVDAKAARARSLMMAHPAPAPPAPAEEEPPRSGLPEPTPTPEVFVAPASPAEDPAPEQPIPVEPPAAETPPAPPEPGPLSDLGTLLGASDLRASGVFVNEPRVESPVEPTPTEQQDPEQEEASATLSEALSPTPPEPPSPEPSIPEGATIDFGDDLTLASPGVDLEYEDSDDDVLVEEASQEHGAIELDFEDEVDDDFTDDEPSAEDTASDAAEPMPPILNRSREDEAEEEPVEWAPPLVKERGSRRWLTPLLATAGLLLIGAPFGYVVWKSAGATPTATASLDSVPAPEFEATSLEAPKEASVAVGDEAIENDDFLDEDLLDNDGEDRVVAANASLSDDDESGVETAAYESTGSVYGDRYADLASAEMDSAADQEAEPLTGFESLGSLSGDSPLVGAPLYDVDTLVEATDLAADAGPAFTSGSLDSDESVAEMGQHYARLCYLAQVLTLLDTGSFDLSLTTVQLEATDVFRLMFQDGGARADSRQIASHWLAWEGRPHGGVFFTGTPDDAGRNGEVYEYRFPLADGDRVYVLTEDKIDPKRYQLAGAKEIGVIGVVVEDPASRIRGYKGDQPRVVWARKTIPLRKAP